MAATTQELVDQSSCLACGIPPGFELPILIYLFAQIADVPADPATLIENARCIECGIPPGMQLAVLIGLAQQIVDNGGGGGGGGGAGCMQTTAGDPEGVLVSACTPALAVDPATKAIYMFTGVAGTNTGWILKV